jgi:S-adenosylmethionine:tRNA ribosyltransferase-isomerase
LPDLLRAGDCLVLNESRVIPARLLLKRLSGGLSEILLLEPAGPNEWDAMVRPARKLPAGTPLELPERLGRATIVGGEGRTRRVRFDLKIAFDEFLVRHGRVPLPPYILHQRKARGEAVETDESDRERYQTVYARPEVSMIGSIAAPTAGLHFTDELLEAVQRRGVELRRVTLHVGAGTFEPIEREDVESHVMHRERYAIDPHNARAIEAARADPARRVVAVGTTALRTLEACAARHGAIVATADATNLFIRPGHAFRAVDALITNFHLPRSTLLILVCAFAGRETILAAYQQAIERQYRFFSYGDAMLIE